MSTNKPTWKQVTPKAGITLLCIESHNFIFTLRIEKCRKVLLSDNTIWMTYIIAGLLRADSRWRHNTVGGIVRGQLLRLDYGGDTWQGDHFMLLRLSLLDLTLVQALVGTLSGYFMTSVCKWILTNIYSLANHYNCIAMDSREFYPVRSITRSHRHSRVKG